MNTAIQVSVVLPVRNEERGLPALLQALAQQDFPSEAFEIIVADGGSDDRTRDVVKEFAASCRVRSLLVDNPGIRSAAGRNAGLLRASGEFIVFIDGHCWLPSRNLLADTVRIFHQTGADCLCRPQPLIGPTVSSLGRAIAAVRASRLGHGRDSLIYDLGFAGFTNPASSGASYRRTAFDLLGGYDQSFDACEDVEFNTRVRKAGMKAYSDPRLAVHYAPRESLAALARQMTRYGRGRMRLAFKHPDSVSLSQPAPCALLLTVFWAMLSRGRSPWLGALPLSLLVLYLLAILGATIQLARKHGLKNVWKAPAIYLVIHFGLGAGMLIEGLSAPLVWMLGRLSRSLHYVRRRGLRPD